MYVGTKDKASKTEAVYFPSRTKIIKWLKSRDNKLLSCPQESTRLTDPNKVIRKKNVKTTKKNYR